MSKTSSIGTILYYGNNTILRKMYTKYFLNVTSISGIKRTRSAIDVSALDTNGWREKVAGVLDYDTLQISGFYSGVKVGNDWTTYLGSKTELYFCLRIPQVFIVSGEKKKGYYSLTFTGLVTGFSTSAEIDDAVKYEGSIDITQILSVTKDIA